MRGGVFFDGGVPVETVEPDIYFDERSDVAGDTDPFAVAREILLLVAGHPNPALQAEVLCLLLEVGSRGCSEQSIATRHGLTRAAVSARIVKLREQVGLPRPVGPMRGDDTRRRCAVAQKRAAMS